jgi:bifunctional DNA-binding transcriptional regulator/antitoxin component of YhaV-PrlF toxin-antitoxin module
MARPKGRTYGPVRVRTGGQITLPIELRRDAGLEDDVELRFCWYLWEDRILVLIGDAETEATADFFRSVGFPARPKKGT